MTRGSLRFFLSVFVCVCLLTVSVPAQKITGDIVGTVDDPTGAVVSGATVAAESPTTGFKVSATTTSTGDYRLVNLPPGTYKLTATASGFKTVVRDAVVAVATVTTSNFHMVVGSEGESITVEASAPLVETIENRLGTLIEGRRIEDLPLGGRDFNSLLESIPGVQRVPGGGFLSVNINGQRATTNNFAVDGIPNNDRYYGESSSNQVAIAGTAATLVPLEGITEFTVQSNPSAEYGVRGGSVINVALKSGTNNFHGQAFWFRHTDFADAKNFFTAPDETIPFRLNQFGGIFGGPIKKDRTFFIVSYQGFRLSNTFAYTADVPTPDEVAGANFCVAHGAVEGLNGVIDTTGYAAGTPSFPEGDDCLIAAQQGLAMGVMAPGPGDDQNFGTAADNGTPNTVGVNLLGFYPIDAAGSIFVASPNRLTVDGFHVKFDHIFNDRHRISAKYIFGDSFQTQPAFSGQLVPAAPFAPDLFNSISPTRSMLAGVNWTWMLSNNKVLESRIGYQRFSQIIDVNNKIDPASLGLNTGPLDPGDFGVPGIYYMGYFGYIGGVAGYPITTAPDASYDLQEHFTWTKGSHTIKIG
ncbi:MAG: carboxypeptidase regulatory-like domain-containing protein, partial [Terriglobales bacterium]